MPVPVPIVLGFGDSIMCGPEEGSYGVPPRVWPQWLAEAGDMAFHRVARAGARTPWMARELLPRVRDGYELACVHVGTNDVRGADWDPPAFAAALDAVLAALVARAKRVCVATVPNDLGRPRAGVKVAALGALVRERARAHRATVVDLDDLTGFRLLFPDSVHPTALGQLTIADRAATALGLPMRPFVFGGARTGVAADLRYLMGRQAAHLLRDRRRRAWEGMASGRLRR